MRCFLTGLVTAFALAMVGATLYLGLASLLGMSPTALAPDAPPVEVTAVATHAAAGAGGGPRPSATRAANGRAPATPLPTPALRALPTSDGRANPPPAPAPTTEPAPAGGNGGTRPAPASPTAPSSAPATADEAPLVTVTEDDLNHALEQALAARSDGPSLENTRVRVAGGQIIVQGRTTGLPIALNVTITARAEARDGRPRLVVTDVASEGFPLPDFLRDELQSRVDQLNVTPLPEGIEITRIEHGDGVLTIYGRRR